MEKLNFHQKKIRFLSYLEENQVTKQSDIRYSRFSDGSKMYAWWFSHRERIKDSEDSTSKLICEEAYNRGILAMNYTEKKQALLRMLKNNRKNLEAAIFKDGTSVNEWLKGNFIKISKSRDSVSREICEISLSRSIFHLSDEDKLNEFYNQIAFNFFPNKTNGDVKFTDGSSMWNWWIKNRKIIANSKETKCKGVMKVITINGLFKLTPIQRLHEFLFYLEDGNPVPKCYQSSVKFSDGKNMAMWWDSKEYTIMRSSEKISKEIARIVKSHLEISNQCKEESFKKLVISKCNKEKYIKRD